MRIGLPLFITYRSQITDLPVDTQILKGRTTWRNLPSIFLILHDFDYLPQFFSVSYSSAAVHTTMSAPGATTPDLKRYKIHHIKLATPGAYTIVEPSAHGAAFGLEMVLDLENASPGSVNVGFSGNWSISGYVDPAPGRRTSALFYFDNETGWIQIGSWRSYDTP